MTETAKREDKLRSDLASLRIDRGAPPARRSRPGRARRIVTLVVLLAIAGAGGAFFLRGRIPEVRTALAVVADASQSGPLPVLSGSGYVVTGDRYISIGVRIPGRIEKYFVEEGQTVHKGDELVLIDDRDYRAALARADAQLAVARANLALADSELTRTRELKRQEVASKQELDVAENKANVARATVAQWEAESSQAKVNLEYTLLRAPTDGVILSKAKEVGEIAVPGGFSGSGDLIRMANLSDMRAQVDVNEADLNRVRMGQKAEVIPDAFPDMKYAAEVVKLYPQVDRQKGTLRIEVHLLKPDAKLLPDMSARIAFLADAPADGSKPPPAVLIPGDGLHKNKVGDLVVWIHDGTRVREQRVETAGEYEGRARITSGLKGGETVVISQGPLRDGQSVRLAQQ